MYKSVNGIAPPYLCDMAITCELSRAVYLLFIEKAKCITLCKRAVLLGFQVSGTVCYWMQGKQIQSQ